MNELANAVLTLAVNPAFAQAPASKAISVTEDTYIRAEFQRTRLRREQGRARRCAAGSRTPPPSTKRCPESALSSHSASEIATSARPALSSWWRRPRITCQLRTTNIVTCAITRSTVRAERIAPAASSGLSHPKPPQSATGRGPT